MPKNRKQPTSSKGKNLRPFHQLSRLPAELRVRIWELVNPEPRVVELHRHFVVTKKHDYLEQIRCLSRAPAILHVCRESRSIAIQNELYQRAFVRGQDYIWVNYEFDMISIKPLDTLWLEAEISLIQRFRFEGVNDEYFFHFASYKLLNFTSLKELHIICQDPVAHWIDIAEERQFPTENVFFMSQDPEKAHMYTRQEMLQMYPARPFPEYSDSQYRQMYDTRIKGGISDVPDEIFFGVPTAESS